MSHKSTFAATDCGCCGKWEPIPLGTIPDPSIRYQAQIAFCPVHAAAPDLLAALKSLVDLIENRSLVLPAEVAFAKYELVARDVRKAIKKAEGR